MDRLIQDVRYALRTFRRARGFTAIAILTLALGIGATTAVFSLVDTLMLRDLPVREPGQLVEFRYQFPGDPRMNMFGQKHYELLRDRNTVFSDLIGTFPFHFESGATGAASAPLAGGIVTGNFFPALGVQPSIGRLIGPEDDKADAPPVAVVSWSYWKSRFNLDPSVLGTRVGVASPPASARTFAAIEATVVGVAPREFSGLLVGHRPDVWLPLSAIAARGPGALMLVGRLKPGVSIEQAQAQMRALDKDRLEEMAKRDPAWRQATLDVTSARAGLVTPLHDQFRMPLLVLMGIVGALLLLACTNVAGMLLARAVARQREMAVRVSLGAGRVRIVQQVLTESVLLASMAGLLGVLLAYFGADSLVRIMASGTRMIGAPPSVEVTLVPDTRVLLFTTAVTMLAAVWFGLAPAWTAFASTPASTLRETGTAGPARWWRRFGNGLVVAQVAVSVVLLSASGLFASHLWNLRNRDLGFRRDSVLVVGMDAGPGGRQRAQMSTRYRELLARLEAIPGVRSATLSGMTPISGAAGSRFMTVEGFDEDAQARRRVMFNEIAPRYFETLGTPLIAGRDFQFEDEGRPRVVIVNQATARYYFGDSSPLGKRVSLERIAEPFEIVGVVADAKYADLRTPAPRTVYLNGFQLQNLPGTLSLRTAVPPASVAGDVRRGVDDVLKARVTRLTTLSEQLDASIVPERLIATLSGFLGGVGALLAALGLYGLLAYTIARRTAEIGIRMALGATRRDVLRMVLRNASGIVSAGVVLGIPLVVACVRFASSRMENLPTQIALPIAFAVVTLMAAALVAAYVPARRAARLHPTEALRHS